MQEDFLQSDHLTGLWIDALVKEAEDRLVFMSAWGSETAIQNVRARLSLPVSESGLRSFRIDAGPYRWRDRVRIEQPERYEQLTGRPSGPSRFLHLTHFWLFPRLALQPDNGNHTAWLLKRPAEASALWEARLWQMVQTLCPVPLHPSWCGLIAGFTRMGWITEYQGFHLSACYLRFPEEDVQSMISRAIRQGDLTLPTTH
jgi:hypothetical protein